MANDKQNLWDNTYRTSAKVYNYYHKGQKIKQKEAERQDLEGKNKQQKAQEKMQFYSKQRVKSMERLQSRKIERKMLIFQSN